MNSIVVEGACSPFFPSNYSSLVKKTRGHVHEIEDIPYVPLFDKDGNCAFGKMIPHGSTPEVQGYASRNFTSKSKIPEAYTFADFPSIFRDQFLRNHTLPQSNEKYVKSIHLHVGEAEISSSGTPILSEDFSFCCGVFLSDKTGMTLGLHIHPGYGIFETSEETFNNFFLQLERTYHVELTDAEVDILYSSLLEFFITGLESEKAEKMQHIMQKFSLAAGLHCQMIYKGEKPNDPAMHMKKALSASNIKQQKDIQMHPVFWRVLYAPKENKIFVQNEKADTNLHKYGCSMFCIEE